MMLAAAASFVDEDGTNPLRPGFSLLGINSITSKCETEHLSFGVGQILATKDKRKREEEND